MRAICEACDRPQPVDWKPGDLCTACGQPVRRELRCFWCVKWTPASGKYCRSCGAHVVEGRLYPAARRLKDAGVDRFGVPKMLAELDPEQIENFTNIYHRHTATMTRHVDHLRFLESFLQHKGWSGALEEQLIVELPWPDARLKELSPPLDPAERIARDRLSREQSLQLARAIGSLTPFLLVRNLASVVRVLLEDWPGLRDANLIVSSGDPLLRGEAALALTHWRAIYGPDSESRYSLQLEKYRLMDALRACPFTFPAAVHLALKGAEGAKLPAGALVSDDPDIAFSAALVAGDLDRLIAAEQSPDPLKRYAAAYRLIRMGVFTGVDEVIRKASPDRQLEILGDINTWKKPAPSLREVFFELLETSGDEDIRKSASWALSRCSEPGDALRIALAAHGDSRIYQSLLQTAATSPEELDQLCGRLLEMGAFRADQWGMSDAAKEGRLPASFVPRHWPGADETARVELCQVAEMQLEAYGDEDLHRFLVNVIFGEEAFAVQLQAWTCLFRWYGRLDHSGGPLRIQAASLQRFFGSVPAFVPILARFLGNGNPGKILHELFVREPLAKFLKYSEPDVLPDLKRAPSATLELADSLRAVIAHPDCDLMLKLACIDLLALLAEAPELRPPMVKILRSFRGTDLDHGSKMGLERIAMYSD